MASNYQGIRGFRIHQSKSTLCPATQVKKVGADAQVCITSGCNFEGDARIAHRKDGSQVACTFSRPGNLHYVAGFRDDHTKDEFQQSGLCQKCQDELAEKGESSQQYELINPNRGSEIGNRYRVLQEFSGPWKGSWTVIDVSTGEIMDAWGDQVSAQRSCARFNAGAHPRSVGFRKSQQLTHVSLITVLVVCAVIMAVLITLLVAKG